MVVTFLDKRHIIHIYTLEKVAAVEARHEKTEPRRANTAYFRKEKN
jgi:hypothetical protein